MKQHGFGFTGKRLKCSNCGIEYFYRTLKSDGTVECQNCGKSFQVESERQGLLDAILAEFDALWKVRESKPDIWSSKEQKIYDDLKTRLRNMDELKESECQKLVDLGKTYTGDNLIRRLWDLALIYYYGKGTGIEIPTFRTNEDLETNQYMRFVLFFINQAIKPWMHPDEEVIHYDWYKIRYWPGSVRRLAHVFLTAKKLLLVGRINDIDSLEPGYCLPVYKIGEKRYDSIIFDPIPILHLRKPEIRDDEVRVQYSCTYDRTFEKTTKVLGTKIVSLQKELETGHLELQFIPLSWSVDDHDKYREIRGKERSQRNQELHTCFIEMGVR